MYLSMHLSIYPSIYLFFPIYLSIHIHIHVYLSIYPSIYLEAPAILEAPPPSIDTFCCGSFFLQLWPLTASRLISPPAKLSLLFSRLSLLSPKCHH